MKVFAAYNPDGAVRAASSAGGVFTMLAERVLAEGGTVYGAVFDENLHVVHARTETAEGLEAMRRSKYAFSHVGKCYDEAVADLDSGRPVLFSGTPCEIAAMRKKASGRQGLLCVEVVCHGAPDADHWNRYINELCRSLGRQTADVESVNFRDKRHGWRKYSFTVKFKDGTEFSESHEDNLYMRAFLNDYSLREACFGCPFKYPEGTSADITIGDLWGIGQIAPEIDNDKGTTLVVARTEAGIKAAEGIGMAAAVDFEAAARHNPALVRAPGRPRLQGLFVREARKGPVMRAMKRVLSRRLVHRILNKFLS